MTDITKCNGKNCPDIVRGNCYRFIEEAGKYQSWINAPIKKHKNGKYTCQMFWGESQEEILKYLNSIVKGKICK
jgi:hypothetical protein